MCVTTHTQVPRHKCLRQNRVTLFELKVATRVFFSSASYLIHAQLISFASLLGVYHKTSAVGLVETHLSNNMHGAVSCRQKDTFEMSPRG